MLAVGFRDGGCSCGRALFGRIWEVERSWKNLRLANGIDIVEAVVGTIGCWLEGGDALFVILEGGETFWVVIVVMLGKRR